MSYAKGTTVAVDKSKLEIEKLLRQHGADEFASGWAGNEAYIMFRLKPKEGPWVRVKMRLTLADAETFRIYARGYSRYKRSDAQCFEVKDQSDREKWRALVLVVKAKLEAVSQGISTIEREFMADILMPGGGTIGEQLPALMQMAALPALPAGGGE